MSHHRNCNGCVAIKCARQTQSVPCALGYPTEEHRRIFGVVTQWRPRAGVTCPKPMTNAAMNDALRNTSD